MTNINDILLLHDKYNDSASELDHAIDELYAIVQEFDSMDIGLDCMELKLNEYEERISKLAAYIVDHSYEDVDEN